MLLLLLLLLLVVMVVCGLLFAACVLLIVYSFENEATLLGGISFIFLLLVYIVYSDQTPSARPSINFDWSSILVSVREVLHGE